jgi:membrane dipeptidase
MLNEFDEHVRQLHEQAIVIDALGGYGFAYDDILSGGIHTTHVTLNMYAVEGFDYVLNQIRRYYSLLEMQHDHLTLIEKPSDILRAKEEKKLGIIFGFQNGGVLGNDVNLLPIFYKLGVRVIQLTYNEANLIGYGCLETRDEGLTSLGRQVIQVMNRLGMLVDLSHVGYKTSCEAVQVSEYPVAITHGNPSALKDLPRNRPDDLIRSVAKKGGVIGLTPYAAFCKSKQGQRPTLKDFTDQIDYVVNLVGIDHVGIGTDKFEGKTREDFITEIQARYAKLIDTPFENRHVEGMSHIRYFPRITEELFRRGYSDEDCMKILGGNFYSLFAKVWKTPSF